MLAASFDEGGGVGGRWLGVGDGGGVGFLIRSSTKQRHGNEVASTFAANTWQQTRGSKHVATSVLLKLRNKNPAPAYARLNKSA